jgi:predicted enzyme related to lactoylglutathione lyase
MPPNRNHFTSLPPFQHWDSVEIQSKKVKFKKKKMDTFVTGIGGVFLKAQDPISLAAWYETWLGIPFKGQTYTAFSWENPHNSSAPGTTVFSLFKESSDYFSPSDKQTMLNLRVRDLDRLLEHLRKAGVWVAPKTEDYPYGRFGWCMDPEGNKLELWEPIDEAV